ncbi:type I-E CRISPR-associated endonuclease Cas1e [Leucobacter allii]|uniref:type I-E CRISPR-associated endonuclease Cas1e n=1 Tax=Leucobacter allii TaxID=2932247 RepID=UPI001FD20CA0|nr:type I-E CRISPR-associated endonuclease Cas1e [Leucobacter allii]UOR01730.1 type I-E CRISPR-associated endonuclease Cas1e [Leucobacter allii]
MAIPGARPAELSELTRVEDRISFLYLERATVHRESNAITAAGEHGTVHVPAASLGVVMLGPGTTVSHHAMMLIAESGSSIVWVGENGVRYYAHGSGLSRNTRLLQAQAHRVARLRERTAVAREMYAMRFPGEDISGLTMQQLRGREGARVRRIYREHAKRTGVPWSKREYDPDDFAGGDVVNQALSAANSSLYGVVHSVIVALGCSPGLGFVHTGHQRSFVYDIADLYKAELTIPLAFDLAADPPLDVGSDARRRVRDALHGEGFVKRCAQDVQRLLLGPSDPDSPAPTNDDEIDVGEHSDVTLLWDGDGTLQAGVNYSAGFEGDGA